MRFMDLLKAALDDAKEAPRRFLAETEPAEYASVMGTFVHEIVPGLSGFWTDQLRRAQARGVIDEGVDLDAGAEWVIRALVSLVGIPGRAVDVDDRASLVDFLEAFLTPAFLTPAFRSV